MNACCLLTSGHLTSDLLAHIVRLVHRQGRQERRLAKKACHRRVTVTHDGRQQEPRRLGQISCPKVCVSYSDTAATTAYSVNLLFSPSPPSRVVVVVISFEVWFWSGLGSVSVLLQVNTHRKEEREIDARHDCKNGLQPRRHCEHHRANDCRLEPLNSCSSTHFGHLPLGIRHSLQATATALLKARRRRRRRRLHRTLELRPVL